MQYTLTIFSRVAFESVNVKFEACLAIVINHFQCELTKVTGIFYFWSDYGVTGLYINPVRSEFQEVTGISVIHVMKKLLKYLLCTL